MKGKISLANSVMVSLTCLILVGCKYYKIRTYKGEKSPISNVISEENIRQNYIGVSPEYFLHVGDQYWTLKNAKIGDNNLITGQLAPVDSIFNYYYNRAILDRKFLIPQKDLEYINQIHIYADQFSEMQDANIKVPIDGINRVDIMKKDLAANTASVIVTTGAIATGAIVGLLYIVCNCPHGYTFDGEQYHFNNTLFTGATSAAMERNDFKELPDYFPESTSYQLMIKNEEKEIHQTNLLELLVVDHSKNTRIFPDQKGEIYNVSNMQSPFKVVSENGDDLIDYLGEEDDLGYEFDHPSTSDFANVYATFKTPQKKGNVKLILKAKNTVWSGVVYHELSQMFGNKFKKWNEKANKRSAEEVQAYRKSAGINLLVSVKKDGEWIDIESIDLIGNVNFNTLVVQLDAQYITDDYTEVRLSTGFKFWKLDYVAIDNTPAEHLNIQRLRPVSAITNGSKDETMALAKDDDNYMHHPKKGDAAIVLFEGLNMSEQGKRTLLLRSKGYYLLMDEFEGKPNWSQLARLKKEGELSKYSKNLYSQFNDNVTILTK